MEIKKVWIEPGCISCGSCQYLAPEVFEVTDRSRVKPCADIIKNKDFFAYSNEIELNLCL